MLYNDTIRARVSDYHAVMWKSIGELCGKVDDVDEDSSGAFVRIAFDYKTLCYVQGNLTPVAVKEAPEYESFWFRLDLHHLLSLGTSEYCIRNKLSQMMCLHPIYFRALWKKIALVACGKAREAYVAGTNSLSIDLRVEVADALCYQDREAVANHTVRGFRGLKKFVHYC